MVFKYKKNSNSYYNTINLDTKVFNNENYISANQLLAGNAIPKTQIPTIVVPPMADMDNFKPNDLVRHSHVNKHTNYDLGRSGYIQDDDCNQKFKQLENKHNLTSGINDIINSRSLVSANQQIEGESKKINANNPDIIKTEKIDKLENDAFNNRIFVDENNMASDDGGKRENFSLIDDASLIINGKQTLQVDVEPHDNYVNKSMGYDPKNLNSNIPVNLTVGEAEYKPQFKDYNKEIHSTILQPGVVVNSQVIEPIISNVGISYPQQLEPYTKKVCEKSGDTVYTLHDPALFQPSQFENEVNEQFSMGVNTSEVFDPRFNSYGTSYRSYIDKMTGQPRFYYDDVDAIRRPNYVTRNDIDTFEFGTSYGPMTEKEFAGNSGLEVRDKAQNEFVNNSIDFRNSLQQSMMRKTINREWQLKKAPIKHSL